MSQKNSDIISRYRQSVTELVNALDTTRNLRKQMDAAGGASAMLPQTEFEGENAEVIAADFVSAVVSVGTIDDFITANFHSGNLYKVVQGR